jgi:hypothetical protein
MKTKDQPEQKVTPDMLFVTIVAVIGCLVSVVGAAVWNLWGLAFGVLFMWVAFKCRKRYKRKHGKS